MPEQRLAGKKIGILMESDFYEHEIFYYQLRFPEEGAELHFLTGFGETRHSPSRGTSTKSRCR